ncbi:MAG: SoxR reducing system RseC family protein [Bacteroidales bacterium]|jgi:positive regulator of sigma E activity|nr:SoxR reducing system RseC family protein [Bacteroidales bacterium]MDD2204492.1 SoxR reducing system RseC family protein [Bacteroidales bacterium]MDD3152771.1 SoxR reducing system RseC family protein [Bacteroidales bacterium]MDD3914606.1 SoxR reducing system RseC family protein [Bacteroidales bacterium]MDD4633825.1 SoxR reducing system RseC family protein [Bacteroidales bacterium]
MKQNIEHSGIITSINDLTIDVQIESNASCGACAAKRMCGMTETQTKTIKVLKKNGSITGEQIDDTNYKVGDKVVVGVASAMGLRAVRLSYLYPTLLLVASLMIAIEMFDSEGVAALVSIAVVAVYYFVLWLFRNKNKVRFYIYK